MLAAFSKNLRVWRTEKIETVTDMNCQIYGWQSGYSAS